VLLRRLRSAFVIGLTLATASCAFGPSSTKHYGATVGWVLPVGRVDQRTGPGVATNAFLLYSAPNVLPALRLSLVHRWLAGADQAGDFDLSTWGGSLDVSWRFYLGPVKPYLLLGQEVSHNSTRIIGDPVVPGETLKVRSWNPGLLVGAGTTLWDYVHLESGWVWLYSRSRSDFGVGGSTGYVMPISIGFRF
jgi:hypothetical protein